MTCCWRLTHPARATSFNPRGTGHHHRPILPGEAAVDLARATFVNGHLTIALYRGPVGQ